jgi:hypothetical protein
MTLNVWRTCQQKTHNPKLPLLHQVSPRIRVFLHTKSWRGELLRNPLKCFENHFSIKMHQHKGPSVDFLQPQPRIYQKTTRTLTLYLEFQLLCIYTLDCTPGLNIVFTLPVFLSLLNASIEWITIVHFYSNWKSNKAPCTIWKDYF